MPKIIFFTHWRKFGLVKFSHQSNHCLRDAKGFVILGKGIGLSKIAVRSVTVNSSRPIQYFGSFGNFPLQGK